MARREVKDWFVWARKRKIAAAETGCTAIASKATRKGLEEGNGEGSMFTSLLDDRKLDDKEQAESRGSRVHTAHSRSKND